MFKLSIALFLLQLSSFGVNAFVHDGMRSADDVSYEEDPEIPEDPINSNVVEDPVQSGDLTSSTQNNEETQEPTGADYVEPTVGEISWSPFAANDDGDEEVKDTQDPGYESEDYADEPSVDEDLDTGSLDHANPDQVDVSYPDMVYDPSQVYATEANPPEQDIFTKRPSDINTAEYVTEPEADEDPEHQQLPSYIQVEDNNQTTSHLQAQISSHNVEPVFAPNIVKTGYWNTFNMEDYQSQGKMEEKQEVEANREPMRPVHRSPVHWLRRDVERLGQPRQPACLMELDRGLGPDEVSSWYYDSREMRCRWFGYRGYGGNANRFASRVACEGYCIKDTENLCEMVTCSWTGTKCTLVRDEPCVESARVYGRDWRTKCPPEQPVCMSRRSTRIAPDIDLRGRPIECLQDKDAGSCQRKNPSVMFHYDRERNDCMTFYFHDCGGNDNRFETKSDCMTHCAP